MTKALNNPALNNPEKQKSNKPITNTSPVPVKRTVIERRAGLPLHLVSDFREYCEQTNYDPLVTGTSGVWDYLLSVKKLKLSQMDFVHGSQLEALFKYISKHKIIILEDNP
jgi:hypothetical protein